MFVSVTSVVGVVVASHIDDEVVVGDVGVVVVGGEVVACAEDDDQVELLVVMYQHDAKLHEVSQDGWLFSKPNARSYFKTPY